MTINDILSLSAAGWTKADITAMAQGHAPSQAQAQDQAPDQAPAPEPAPAPDMSHVLERLNAIDARIQNSAMMRQPAPQQKDSSFDVLAKIINPEPPRKGGI